MFKYKFSTNVNNNLQIVKNKLQIVNNYLLEPNHQFLLIIL